MIDESLTFYGGLPLTKYRQDCKTSLDHFYGTAVHHSVRPSQSRRSAFPPRAPLRQIRPEAYKIKYMMNTAQYRLNSYDIFYKSTINAIIHIKYSAVFHIKNSYNCLHNGLNKKRLLQLISTSYIFKTSQGCVVQLLRHKELFTP